MRAACAEMRNAQHRWHMVGPALFGTVEPLGRRPQPRRQIWRKVQPQKPCRNGARHAGDRQPRRQMQEGAVGLIEFADDAGAHIGAPVEQLLLDLVLDDLTPFLDDQHLFQPAGKGADAFGFQRPGHPHLVKPQPHRCLFLRAQPQFGERLAHILERLARGHDAKPRARMIDHQSVHPIGARKGNGGIALVFLQPFILHQWRIRPAQVQPAGGQLKIRGKNELPPLLRQIDNRRNLDRFRDDLEPHPAARIARHGDAQQSHLQKLMDG